MTDLQAASPSKYNGENSGVDLAVDGADSNVAHHERRELQERPVVIIIIIIIVRSSAARRARSLLDSPRQAARVLQKASPMKVSMMFTILDAEGSAVTEKTKIVEINSEGLAKIEFGLIKSEIDEWGTGLCDGDTLEVEPIECLENCDNYEEFLAGGFTFTYDVSKCLLFGNETFRSLCAVSP